MNSTEIGLSIMEKRILRLKPDGTKETPQEALRRVAHYIAQADARYGRTPAEVQAVEDSFYQMMDRQDFMPNSPTFTGAGTDLGQLSACFVLPVPDSLEAIYDTMKDAAITHKTGGGTGFSFSRLRPNGDRVRSSQGVASGPVSFMRVYNASTEAIKQGGCFPGNTLVATANGPVPIKDLKEGTLVYAWDGKFVLVPCTDAWKTKTNAEVWKVTTDKGLTIYATPDHPFMVRWSGPGSKKEYVKLKDLKPGTPLMPLTRYVKDGEWWISLHDGADTRMPEHLWMAQELGITGEHIHHKDGNILELFDSWDNMLAYLDEQNHRVVSVEFSHYEDVYNVEVPGPHNYVVCDDQMRGVVVSNTRRGANMGILRIDHPDVLEFIHCKDDTSQITNFNISVGITDEFMKALEADEEYDLINPRSGEAVGRLRAREVWDQLVLGAWKTGEPGIVFLDRMNRRNPNGNGKAYRYVDNQGRFIAEDGTEVKEGIEATNPCGEQPLPPYGSCNLGSINLANFVLNPYTDQAEVDWERLFAVAALATHFLDNVIDQNHYPIPEIAEKARRDRRIGLGIMGWAEMLVQLGLAYDSEEAVELATEVMRHIKSASLIMSIMMATDRGVYPEWEGSLWEQAGVRLRNATLTTVAPTGTISMLAAQSSVPQHELDGKCFGMPCSGGIEPKFALVFTRNQANMQMLDIDQQFEYIARKEGWYSEALMKRIAKKGTCRGIRGVPEKWQRIFATSHDISPEWHVRMQAAFQGGDDCSVISQPIDAACSKTINFPHTATVEDVDKAYWLAWQLGLKGCTVYRDGARQGQVLSVGEAKDEPPGEDLPDEHAGMMTVNLVVDPNMELAKAWELHTEEYCPRGGTIKNEGGCVSCTCGWSLCHIS